MKRQVVANQVAKAKARMGPPPATMPRDDIGRSSKAPPSTRPLDVIGRSSKAPAPTRPLDVIGRSSKAPPYIRALEDINRSSKAPPAVRGTGRKKKETIATKKALMPYFDIMDDPYFIKV